MFQIKVAMQDQEKEFVTRASAAFHTTHWSVVHRAKQLESPEAAEALNKLCHTYWRPLYSYIRRRGHSPAKAEDLTQQFFARWMEKNYLNYLRHQDGKFRSFLLTLLNHFLSDEYDKENAQKRQADKWPVMFDALSEEERYKVEPRDNASPEWLFDRRWAETVLEQAVRRLREEYYAAGNGELYEALKDFQPGQSRATQSYEELALRLGKSESAIASAIHRLRHRHAELLRAEVAQTVASGDDINDEIRYLVEVLSR